MKTHFRTINCKFFPLSKVLFLVLLFTSIFPTSVFSQLVTQKLVSRFKLPGFPNASPRVTISVADGYLFGIDESSSGNGIYNSGFHIVKVSKDGSSQWTNTSGTEGYDAVSCIIPTSDGGFLVGGTTTVSSGGLYPKVNVKYLLTKISGTGGFEWQKVFSGGRPQDNPYFHDVLQSIVPINNGASGYLLAGTSNSPIGGQKSDSLRGARDYWIIKISPDGTYEWDKTFGGTEDDFLTSCLAIEKGAGGFILVGGSSSRKSGNKRAFNLGMWAVKISDRGVHEWDEGFGGGSPGTVPKIIPSIDKIGYIIIGSVFNYGNRGCGNQDVDYLICKIGLTGELIWRKVLGGCNLDTPTDIYAKSDSYYVVGNSHSGIYDSEKTEPSTEQKQTWLSKIVDTGSSCVSAWDRTLEGIWPASIFDAGGGEVLIKASGLSKEHSFIKISESHIMDEHPKPAEACVGQYRNFSVKTVGEGYKYQWQRRRYISGFYIWESVPTEPSMYYKGWDTPTLSVYASWGDRSSYRCLVFKDADNFLVSLPATLAISTSAPFIPKQSDTLITRVEGERLQLSVAAAGENLRYQWFKDSQTISGANFLPYFRNNAVMNDAGTYQCQISNSCGAVSSRRFKVSIKPANGGSPFRMNASSEQEADGLVVKVLGNPVVDGLVVEVKGIAAYEVVSFVLSASNGNVIATKKVIGTGQTQQIKFSMTGRAPGLYLLNTSTVRRRYSVKVLKI